MENRPLRVLYLINFAGKAGTEKYVENLVDYLHPHKCECSLCYNIDGPLADKMREKGIPCHQLEMRSPFDKKAAKELARICRENKIDVIHAQMPRENYIAILSKKYYDVKVVFTSHLTIYQNAVWKFFNNIMTKKNHKVISVCQQGKDILVLNKVRSEKIEVVYNGIDPDSAAPRDRAVLDGLVPEGAVTALILARLAEEKGLKFLIDAVKLAKEKTNTPFCLLIAGDGEQKAELEAKIAELGLCDCVKLLGFRTDGAKLLAASDIYLNSSSSNEAMSFAILEALAAGLPLVVTDVGGNTDLVHDGGKCGFVVNYGDTAGFADSLVRLIESPELRAEYSVTARKKAENEFALGGLLEKVYELYR